MWILYLKCVNLFFKEPHSLIFKTGKGTVRISSVRCQKYVEFLILEVTICIIPFQHLFNFKYCVLDNLALIHSLILQKM